MDFGPYGIFINMCYNLWHGNAVKGFWTLCILSIRWSIGDHLTVRDFGPYAIIFTNVCHNRYQCKLMLLSYFGPYGIIFMTVFTTSIFPIILDTQFTSKFYKIAFYIQPNKCYNALSIS
jgi:hypothetical protein